MSLYWQMGGKPEYTEQVIYSIFFVCVAQLSLYQFSTVLEFQIERAVFIREFSSSWYKVLPYYLSKLVLELPLLLILPLVENLMSFWSIGYRDGAFFEFYLVMILTV